MDIKKSLNRAISAVRAWPRQKKILVSVVAVLAAILLGLLIFLLAYHEPEPTPTEPSTEVTTIPEETEPVKVEKPKILYDPMIPEQEEPEMLDWMAELYAENPDIVGWIKIEGTKVDYPVMHTPDDPEKYLYLGFDGEYDIKGTLFIDANCSMDPESDDLIIYGHNMKNGTMFRTLMSYKKESYWKAHPTIQFSTLYEERTYEIVAAFYDRVYKKSDTCFKFYKFIDPASSTEFNEAIAYYKENSLYDTGVDARYGDSLITLVTCSYHTTNGKFVVVAREVRNGPAPTSAVECPLVWMSMEREKTAVMY